jgi:hypothetical protein
MNETATPLFYLRALSMTDDDFSTVTTASVKAAYREAASNGLHPDHGGDEKMWSLITSAYNELKAITTKKRGKTLTKTDEAWLRDFMVATEPVADEPKPAADVPTEWVFEDIEGESKEDRRKRYARTRQAYRYATDPEYAASRKAASLKSHAKSNAAKKAAKEAREAVVETTDAATAA